MIPKITDLYEDGKTIGSQLFDALESELDEKIASIVFRYFGKINYALLMFSVPRKPKLKAFFEREFQEMHAIEEMLKNSETSRKVNKLNVIRYLSWLPMPSLMAEQLPFDLEDFIVEEKEKTAIYTSWLIDLLGKSTLKQKISDLVGFEQFLKRRALIVRRGEYISCNRVIDSWRENAHAEKIEKLFNRIHREIKARGYDKAANLEVEFNIFSYKAESFPKRSFKRHLIKQVLEIIFMRHLRLFQKEEGLNQAVIKTVYREIYKVFSRDVMEGRTSLYLTDNLKNLQVDQNSRTAQFLIACKWLKACRISHSHRPHLFLDLYHAAKASVDFDKEQRALFPNPKALGFLYPYILEIKKRVNDQSFDLIAAEKSMLYIMEKSDDAFSIQFKAYLERFASNDQIYPMRTLLNALENHFCHNKESTQLVNFAQKIADIISEEITDPLLIAAASHFDVEVEELTQADKEFLEELKAFELNTEQKILLFFESKSFQPKESKQLTFKEHIVFLHEVQAFINEPLPKGFAFDFLMMHYIQPTQKKQFGELKMLRDEVILYKLNHFTIFDKKRIFRISSDSLCIKMHQEETKFYISRSRFQMRLKALMDKIQYPFSAFTNFDPGLYQKGHELSELQEKLKKKTSLDESVFKYLSTDAFLSADLWSPITLPQFGSLEEEFIFYVQFYPDFIEDLASKSGYYHFFPRHEKLLKNGAKCAFPEDREMWIYELYIDLKDCLKRKEINGFRAVYETFQFIKMMRVTTRSVYFESQIGKDLQVYKKELKQRLEIAKKQFIDKLESRKSQLEGECPPSIERDFFIGALNRNLNVIKKYTLSFSAVEVLNSVVLGQSLDDLSQHFPILESTRVDGLELIECELVKDPNTVNKLYFKKKNTDRIELLRDAVNPRDIPSEKASENRYYEALKKYSGETVQLESSMITSLLNSISINSVFEQQQDSEKKYLYAIISDLLRHPEFTINGVVFSQKKLVFEVYEKCLKAFNGNEKLTQNALILTTQAVTLPLTVYTAQFQNSQLGFHKVLSSQKVKVWTNKKGKVEIQYKIQWQTVYDLKPYKNSQYLDSSIIFSIDPKDLERGDGASATVTAKYSQFQSSEFT